jgi:hypothetical protein
MLLHIFTAFFFSDYAEKLNPIMFNPTAPLTMQALFEVCGTREPGTAVQPGFAKAFGSSSPFGH